MLDAATDWSISQRAHRAEEQPIGYLLRRALAEPGLISLAAGFVDQASLPAGPLREIITDLLAHPDDALACLQYGQTEGLPPLRRTLYERMAAEDHAAPDAYPGGPDQVIVSTGSQQLLHLLADVLLDPGDIILTAWPSYFVFTGALGAFGATVRAVETDEHGLIPEQLDDLLTRLRQAGELDRVKMVYVNVDHDNPTGLTLSEDRRPQLLDIVARHSVAHRILLVEDAAYRELTYDGEPPLSIKRHDINDQFVAQLRTFSKPFAPGLRTGYGLLPADLTPHVAIGKAGRDFGSAHFCQHILLRALTSGAFDAQVAQLRTLYRAKRNAMLHALDAHMPPGVAWTRPAGGLYVWLTLPPTIDTTRHGPLFGHAIEQGVLFVPGVYCYPPDPTRTPPRNTIRLSFGVADEGRIADGIQRLGDAICRVM